jgi:cell volume regulation protein A
MGRFLAAPYIDGVTEPTHTAVGLAVLGVLMLVSVLLSRVAGWLRVPLALMFLGVGMLAGAEGVGRIPFADYRLSFRLGTVTLVLILFDGGLNTSYAAIRRAAAPAITLATAGVVSTMVLLAIAARLLGFSWPAALLVGAIVSSTDAASVFAVLRASRIALVKRVATTLELESGLNDPVAVLFTVALTGWLRGEHPSIAALALLLVEQLLVGFLVGVAIGRGGRWVLGHARPAAAGLLPVFTIALGFSAFGVATLMHGSGFLATYCAAVVLGNGAMPYRTGILRVHDALAWLGQVVMFVVLGLISFPHRLLAVGAVGLVLGLALALVARPLAVVLCLLPFRFRARETLFVAWVGLRGAVPIILAILPLLAGAPEAGRIFDVVLFIVVVSALVPGAMVTWMARQLRVEVNAAPPPAAVLEIASTFPLRGDVHAFYLAPSSAVSGAPVGDVPLPPGAAIVLLLRARQPMAPQPETVLATGDHVFVFCHAADLAEIALLFGRVEE